MVCENLPFVYTWYGGLNVTDTDKGFHVTTEAI